MLSLIENVAEFAPNLLNKALKINAFSRSLSNGVFEICPCENEISCNNKEFHNPKMKFGEPTNVSILKIFNISMSLDYTIDEKFNF